jgi:hypothetical protein
MFGGIADEAASLAAGAGRVTGRWNGAAQAPHDIASNAAISLAAGPDPNGCLFRVVIVRRSPHLAYRPARRK